MKESLKRITDVVDWYKKQRNPSPALLLESLRIITAHLYILETHRAEYHKQFQEIIFNHEGSVARATNEAEVKVPELYMLRRVMEAAYRVADAMRTQISFLKYEMEHTKTEV